MTPHSRVLLKCTPGGDLVAPHQWAGRGNPAHYAALCHVIDIVEFGIALVDADCRVLYLNAAAAHIVGCHDGVRVHERQLVCRCAQGHSARDLVRTVLGDAATESPQEVLVKIPPTLTAPELAVVVRRLRGSEDTNMPALAVVFIAAAKRPSHEWQTLIANAFHLSTKESALALAMLQGKTLHAHSREQGTTVATARTHLRSLMLKTRTCRQAELVSLLWAGMSGFLGWRV